MDTVHFTLPGKNLLTFSAGVSLAVACVWGFLRAFFFFLSLSLGASFF